MARAAERSPRLEDLDPAQLSTDSKMALVRTRLAFERTFMAWIRTGISLITFGFALNKAADYLEVHGKTLPRERLVGPREFGTLMVGIGVLGLIAAVLQRAKHGSALRELNRTVPVAPVGVVVAVAFVLLGLAAMFETLTGR
jgi:putative membrane protein